MKIKAETSMAKSQQDSDFHQLLMLYGRICSEDGYLSTKPVTMRMDIAVLYMEREQQANRQGQLKIAKMFAAIGRDDFTWGGGGLPEEVLEVFPEFRSSTADIPRGKKQFIDFVIQQLSQPHTQLGEEKNV